MPCTDDRLPTIAYAPVPSLDWTVTVRLANAGSATMPACLEYDAMAIYPQEPA